MDVTARPLDESDAFRLDEELFEPSGVMLTAYGELDMATAPELRARLSAAIEAGVRRVVFDLRPLEFLDSVAVAVMLHARKLLGDEGRLVVVVSPESYTHLVFEIAGLPQCLDVVATRDEALERVSG